MNTTKNSRTTAENLRGQLDEFTNYLQSKNLARTTQQAYARYVNRFIEWYEMDILNCTKKDIISYLSYLQDKKNQQSITRRNALIALNHYFTFLIKTDQLTSNPTAFIKLRGTQKKMLYRTYTTEELTTLYDNYYHTFIRIYDDNHMPKNQRVQSALSKQRNAVILNILINQGTTTKEVDMILLQDLDLVNAKLKIRGGKKSNGRALPLQATQIGLLMNYLQHIRPQLLEYHGSVPSDKLFLTLPETSKQTTKSQTVMSAFKQLVKQVESLDPHFENFKQIRASVITNWLKSEGLRKTQYFAGHRYISSTEKYLAGELESLSDDLSKYNPFS